MKSEMMVAAMILSAAGVMEAAQIRVPLVQRQTVPQVKQPVRVGKTEGPRRNVRTRDRRTHGVTYSRPRAAAPMSLNTSPPITGLRTGSILRDATAGSSAVKCISTSTAAGSE